MVGKFWKLCIIFHIFFTEIYATEVLIQDVTFTPAYFYVGDEVIVNFWFNTTSSQQIESGLYHQSDNLVVQDIQLIRNDNRVYATIKFRSFAVGRQVINFDFGDVQTNEITISTRSLVDEGFDQPRTIYSPKLLENTKLFIIIVVSVLLLFFPIILLSIHLTRYIMAFYQSRKMIPYRIFIRNITQLIRNESQLNDAQYYSQLSLAMRQYLTHHLHLHALASATPQEVENLLMPFFNQEINRKLAYILQRSDTIRFGGRYAEAGEREEDTNFILSIAKLAEKWKDEVQQ